MANNKNMLIGIVVVVIALVVFGGGDFLSNLGGDDSGNVGGDGNVPSDLKTTITLNTGDALATTATDANVTYYVFDSSGKYLESSTTSTGTASFTVPVNQEYTLILMDDNDGIYDYLPLQTTFNSGNGPEETLNYDLFRESNVTISSTQDPIDLNTNVSHGLGQTSAYDVLIKAELSSAAAYKPVMRITFNATSVESVALGGLSEVSCPSRLTTTLEQSQTCFDLGIDYLKSAQGIVRLSGSVLFDSITAQGQTEDQRLGFTVLDTCLWKETDWKSSGLSAFKEGTEDSTDKSNCGSHADSAVSYVGFDA